MFIKSVAGAGFIITLSTKFCWRPKAPRNALNASAITAPSVTASVRAPDTSVKTATKQSHPRSEKLQQQRGERAAGASENPAHSRCWEGQGGDGDTGARLAHPGLGDLQGWSVNSSWGFSWERGYSWNSGWGSGISPPFVSWKTC